MSSENKAIVDMPYDIENSIQPFGKRWGGQTITLDENDLQQLQAGKFIALDIENEYVVYLQIEKASNKM